MANYVSKHTGAQIDEAVEQVGVLDGKVITFSEEIAGFNIKKTYVSPEMFGASGDGTKDDTVAFQECIDYAIANGIYVIAAGKYVVSSPITIKTQFISVNIHRLEYYGKDCAVIAAGNGNRIHIDNIYAPNGAAFRLHATTHCYHNNIYLGWVTAGLNAVEYIATNYNIICNNLTFGRLVCGAGYACIYHSPDLRGLPTQTCFHNNNNFTGGKLSGGAWGVFNAKAQDTYMTCHFEDIDNCIHQNGIGNVRIISPRYVEVQQDAIDVTLPDRPIIAGKGIVYRVEGVPAAQLTDGVQTDFQCTLDAQSGSLWTTNIDITDAPTSHMVNGEEMPLQKADPPAREIDTVLLTRHGELIAHSFMIFCNHILIKEPAYKATKHLTANDKGYQGDYRTVDEDRTEFFIYDTFAIDESGCDYTLPPSYDNSAFKQFYVEQSEGTSCVLRDWRGTLIFNGAEYGAGMFEVTAKVKILSHGDFYDNRNQIWEIRRMSDRSLVDTMPHEAT